MITANAHGRIIADIAKAYLVPLGCRRKGRSRFWFSDECFWLIGIEFQPSSWSRGAYLNVGANWLWYPRKSFSFDYGGRIGEFVPYENEAQFKLALTDLTQCAVEEISHLRKRFRSMLEMTDHLTTFAGSRNFWPVYHAAVASGLVGNAGQSDALFQKIENAHVEYEWQSDLQSISGRLADCLLDPTSYSQAVLDLIEQCRALRGLPPGCGFDAAQARA